MSDTQSPPADIPELQWSAPIHAAHKRTTRWYATGGIIVLAVAAYGLISGAWSVSLVAVLCGAMYFLIRSHVFPDSTITLSERGVKLDNSFMPWSEAQGFWILVTPEYSELHVVPLNQRSRELVIQTGNQDLTQIREVFLRRIPELAEKEERLVDAIIRICKL